MTDLSILSAIPKSAMHRFLLVSIHAGSLKGQADQIEREGFEADIAESLEHLHGLLSEGSYDASILFAGPEATALGDLIAKTRTLHPKTIFTVVASRPEVKDAVAVMKAGAFDYVTRVAQQDEATQLHEIVQSIVRHVRARRMELRIDQIERDISRQSMVISLLSREPSVQQILDRTFQLAPTTTQILIAGTIGTGKSVLAHAIHQRTSQPEAPFVEVHCSNPSAAAMHAEIFGHAENTLPGVPKAESGKIALAEGGTLFFHEIGDLPLDVQHVVLQLMTEGTYYRYGERHPRQARLRLLFSTHHNLEQKAGRGEFLPALLALINKNVVTLPPLSQRAADIPIFAENFLSFYATQTAKNIRGFSKASWRRLLEYPWPGNLRELRNVIEQAVIRCQNPFIEIADLPDHVSGIKPGRLQIGENASLSDLEFEHIRLVLARSKTLDGAAKTLGIDPATLYRKRKRMNL